jgi:O-antigen ligase
MAPSLALYLCAALLVWLFFWEWRSGASRSWSLWIPTAWFVIIGSRFVSEWFGAVAIEGVAHDQEGSPFDRNVFLALIVVGTLVVLRRKLDWRRVFSDNKWLLIYAGYLALSILWSDYPISSFKRWIKDVGNIIMVLIVLSEASPVGAVRTLLARATYLLVPTSLVLIKYFPNLSRNYHPFTYEPSFTGVTTNKNMLGIALFVSGLFLVWSLLEPGAARAKVRSTVQFANMLVLLAMVFWLLAVVNSATAIVCLSLSAATLLALRVPTVRRQMARAGIHAFWVTLLVVPPLVAFNVPEKVTTMLGRDSTLTDRTVIWELVLAERTNPLVGTGFYSFWMGDRPQRLSERFYFRLNSAHNSYLETYLNTGLIGVALLIAFMGVAILSTCRTVGAGKDGYAAFRLSCLVGLVAYGMTEALYNRLGLVWFMLLLMTITVTRPDAVDEKVVAPVSLTPPERPKLRRWAPPRAPAPGVASSGPGWRGHPPLFPPRSAAHAGQPSRWARSRS